MFEIREIKNKREYNPLLIFKQAPFTQSWFYGEWQEMMPAQGWSASGRGARRFVIKDDSEIVGFFQIIKYPLVLSKNLIYIPHAPLLLRPLADLKGQADFLKIFREKLMKIAKEENAIFTRFDPVVDFDNASAVGGRVNAGGSQSSTTGFDLYFRKVPAYMYQSAYFQPKFEWFLDVDKPKSELLSNMHPKTRYNIRLAENKGVLVEIINNNFSKYFEDFYSLMEKTARRDGFSLHPKIYYQNIFRNCEENNNAFLVVAKYNDKILATNLILLFGGTAFFIFGGSSDEFRNLMAPHLAHWRGVIEAKNRGCKFYNFGAVNPDGKGDFSAQGGPASGWEGISRFKRGFGGRLLEYSDSYDLVLNFPWYLLYGFAKSIRQTLYFGDKAVDN